MEGIMDVKPGYKMTDVGVIPEDWTCELLSEFFSFISYGFTNPMPTVQDGVFMITAADINDGRLQLETARKTSEAAYRTLLTAKSKPRKNDILLTKDGTLGRLALVGEETICINQSVAVIRPNERVEPQFLKVLLESSHYQKRMVEDAGGSTIKHIYITIIDKMPLGLPFNKSEQRAIATALGDVDALMAGLDRLIAKKRDLKQAAMQQLLTGQTRLPGFSGEWEVKRLKQVAEISTGINKPLSEMGSGALYVTVQDLYDGTSIRTYRLSRIKVSASEIEAKCLAVGDIVFGKSSVKREGIGYPSQFLGCEEPVVFSGFTYRARARQGIADARFLFYALRTEKTRRWLIDNSQASALTNINQLIADAIPVQFPPTLIEQTAIAAFLSDIDAELMALEARRDKTRDLKQGMMQELLTGRTRLV